MAKTKTSSAKGRRKKAEEPSLEHVVELMGSALFADKQRAIVSGLIDYSDAAEATTASLKESGRSSEAEAAEAVTKFLRSNADALATTSPDHALDKIREIARDHPALFTCGAVAAGAAVVWWLTSERAEDIRDKIAPDEDEAA